MAITHHFTLSPISLQ